jgi:predicted transcriptional regulator
MFIRNKSDPIVHIRSVLKKKNLKLIDKVILTAILIEPYIQLGFSTKEYCESLGISKSGMNSSLSRLNRLNMLRREKKGESHGNRYRYILDCSLLK